MINSKRTLKDTTNVYHGKSRTKSIYRGDQSHTVSMNLRIDQDISPEIYRQGKDPYLVTHKQSFKENRVHKFRDSLKITEASLSGKKSYREDITRRSSKKIMQGKPLETDRLMKQVYPAKSRKSIKSKNEKSIIMDKGESRGEIVSVNQAELKDFLEYLKRLASQNTQLRKQIGFLKKDKHKDSALRALGC